MSSEPAPPNRLGGGGVRVQPSNPSSQPARHSFPSEEEMRNTAGTRFSKHICRDCNEVTGSFDYVNTHRPTCLIRRMLILDLVQSRSRAPYLCDACNTETLDAQALEDHKVTCSVRLYRLFEALLREESATKRLGLFVSLLGFQAGPAPAPVVDDAAEHQDLVQLVIRSALRLMVLNLAKFRTKASAIMMITC